MVSLSILTRGKSNVKDKDWFRQCNHVSSLVTNKEIYYRMQIEMALNTLQAKQECEELQFWGKINGLKNDYYIAVAIKYRDMFEFPVKTFFWALSTDFEFKEMPSLTS